MMRILPAGLTMIALAACAASPEERSSIEPLANPVSLLKVGFVAASPEEETTATEVRQGTRVGLIARTASGKIYPLPGYVSLSGDDLQRGLSLGFSGKSPEAAFAYESDPSTITLIYVDDNQLKKKYLRAPSDALLRSVELPVAPFLAGLRDNPRQSTNETALERNKLLAGIRAEEEQIDAILGAAIGYSLMSVKIAKNQNIVHWKYNNKNFEPANNDDFQKISFGYTRSDADRWLVESSPAGARIVGLGNSGEPRTNTTISNLRESDAVKLTIEADGYHPCSFIDAQRSIVLYRGLEWIRLFCTLTKAN